MINFNISASKRMSPRTQGDIITYLQRKNSFRWWRLNHDYKWLQRQMKKMGYNPEEAKDLL